MTSEHLRWVEGALSFDKVALGKLVTAIEDERPQSAGRRGEINTALAHRPVAPVVGLTGAPGVGKSTLVAALCAELTQTLRVAVIAVDPSSPVSGGSVLGDRTRLSLASLPAGQSERLFFRSQAAGGLLGGLSPSTYRVAYVLCRIADLVLVETVGVGQSEIDVCHLADRSLLLVAPESGDDIQFMKAGLLEQVSMVVVTKSDLGASAVLAHLRGALGSRQVALVSARTGRGIAELGRELASTPRPSPAELRARDDYFFRAWVSLHYGRLGALALTEWTRAEPVEIGDPAREAAFHDFFVDWLPSRSR